MSMLERLKKRKLVKWTVTYLAGAWLLIDVFSTLREELDWASWLFPILAGVLAVGFVVTLVLAWYHGEQGRQRVSGPELLLIGGILLVAALLLPLVLGSDSPGGTQEAATPQPSEVAESPFEGLPGIAVLPFENLSRDPEAASLTGGIRYDLTKELSRLSGLKVISETSGYEDTPAPQLGAELGVRYVLRGGVQRAADDIQINVQLIETEQGAVVWGENYPRQFSVENLLEIQETIVLEVASELSVELSSEERARLARARTDSDEAYELYLRASWLSSGPSGGRPIDMLERAVELDSTFVDAWAILSSFYSGGPPGSLTPTERQRARETAERAVELDSTNVFAQLAMGTYHYSVRDFEQALEWLEKGAGTLQGDAWYEALRSNVERRVGRWGGALRSSRRSVVLAPQFAGWWIELGNTHLFLHQYAEAERSYAVSDSISGETHRGRDALIELMRDGALSPSTERALGPAAFALERGNWAQLLDALEDLEDSDAPVLDLRRGVALRGLGREAEAVEAFTRVIDQLQDRTTEAPDDPGDWSILGMAYAALGRSGEAREVGKLSVQLGSVEDYDALAGTTFLFNLAVTYTWLGDHERAIDTLDRLLSVPSWYTSDRLENHALLADLHDDARFQAVMDEHRGRVFLGQ